MWQSTLPSQYGVFTYRGDFNVHHGVHVHPHGGERQRVGAANVTVRAHDLHIGVVFVTVGLGAEGDDILHLASLIQPRTRPKKRPSSSAKLISASWLKHGPKQAYGCRHSAKETRATPHRVL